MCLSSQHIYRDRERRWGIKKWFGGGMAGQRVIGLIGGGMAGQWVIGLIGGGN